MKWITGVVVLSSIALTGCLEEDTVAEPPPIRGLVTTLVSDTKETTVRRYPGVIEPGEVNLLSFEVGGRLGRIDLSVGQTVQQGQVLAEVDDEQYQSLIENRQAAVEEMRATLAQAEADLERSETLLAQGAGTVVRRDEDRTAVMQNRARLTQAEKDLASAQQDLADTKLYAPFDGLIDSIEVESFATVGAGQTVLTVYERADYEVSFSVSFEVIGQLVVGTPAVIRLADDPSVTLAAVVTELGERAGQVSSFPVVVTLEEVTPVIKAGMAVEVSFEFGLPTAQGHLIPISASLPDTEIPEGHRSPTDPIDLEVFVYDPETSTVKRRIVTMAGIRENQFVIISGLETGERVASKGVTYLREGMEVRLLPDREEP
ncbi:MAG: efflux RND transporter periplasmic adaptor subunit [Rhodospirillaceae bacterium]